MALKKNTAGQKLTVVAIDSDGNELTGDAANITAKVRGDYGTPAALADTNPTEVESGIYEFDLTAAETNFDHVQFIVVSSTSGVSVRPNSGENGETVEPSTVAPSGFYEDVPSLRGFVTSLDKRRILATFYGYARDERLAVGPIGDSTVKWGSHFNGGFGHAKGLAYAAADRYGLYATGVLPMQIASGSWNYSDWEDIFEDRGLIPGGAFTRYADDTGRFTNESAPAALHAYAVAPRQGDPSAFPGGGMPWGYLYCNDSHTVNAVNLNRGPHWWKPGDLTRPGLLNIDANLRYHLRYGTFATGSGSFSVQCLDWEPSIINNEGVSHAFSPTINPVTGVEGLADLTLDIPAGARGANGITIRPVQLNDADGDGARVNLEGPFFGLWQTLENVDQATGVAVNIAGHFGGQTARHAADYYLGTDGSAAAGFNVRQAQQEFWRFCLATQRASIADAKLMIPIYFATNDIAGVSTEDSLGPNPSPSNTKEGYADNHKAIVDRIRGDLAAIGATLSNVLFVLGPYHTHPQRDAAQRNEWANELELAFADDDRVVVFRGESLMTEAEINTGGGYDAAGQAHLTAEAYKAFARATLIAGEQVGSDATAAQFTALDAKTTSVQATLGDLTEDSGGTQRLTAAALAEAPAGGGSSTTYFTRFGTSSNARTAELLGVTHPATVYATIADSVGDYYDFSAETFTTPGSGALSDLALTVASIGEAQPPALGIESYAAFALPAGDYTVIWRDGQSASDTILATMPFYADGSRVWESRADAECSAVNTTLADGGEVREAIDGLQPTSETRDLKRAATVVRFPKKGWPKLRGIETVYIAPGDDDLRVSLMLTGTRLISEEDADAVVPDTMTDPQVEGDSDIAATKLGTASRWVSVSLACAETATPGDKAIVTVDVTNSNGAGPIAFSFEVLVVDPAEG